MAQISKSVQDAHGIVPHRIDPAIVARISQDELLDRLTFVQTMKGQAERAADPVIAECYRSVANAALGALPRAEVEAKARGYRAKASLLGRGGPADALLRMADEVERRNPVPPRRAAVAKAGADPVLVPVYDADGSLIGVVDELAITPVCDPDVVAKAATAGMVAVFSGDRRVVGFTAPADVIPVVGGSRRRSGRG